MQVCRHAGRQAGGQAGKQAGRQAGGQAGKQSGRQAGRQCLSGIIRPLNLGITSWQSVRFAKLACGHWIKTIFAIISLKIYIIPEGKI